LTWSSVKRQSLDGQTFTVNPQQVVPGKHLWNSFFQEKLISIEIHYLTCTKMRFRNISRGLVLGGKMLVFDGKAQFQRTPVTKSSLFSDSRTTFLKSCSS
jgi:hypothetical protein